MFGKRRDTQQNVRNARISYKDASFRRSATLTGSVSSGVKAANEERGALKSDRLVRQELQRKQRKIMTILVAVVITASAIYYVISQFIFNIDSATYQNSVFVSQPPSDKYTKSINEYLRENPGERFTFSLNRENIVAHMQTTYPEIASVEITDTKNVLVTLRKPIAVWSTQGGQKNFVDDNGEAFSRNVYPEPAVQVNDTTGAATINGNVVASKSFLRFLGRVVALTNQSGIGIVKEATLPPNTTRQIDILLEGREYVIKLHTDRDPAQEVEDLKRVDRYLTEKNIKPQYIDLRISGKAYYK